MNIGSLIRGLIGDVKPGEPKALELKEGQVVRGVVLNVSEDGKEATVQIQGTPVKAELETPLQPGQSLALRVGAPGEHGLPVLQLAPSGDGEITPQNMGETLKQLGLTDAKLGREIITALRSAGLPLTPETAGQLQQVMNAKPAAVPAAEWLEAAVVSMKRGLPVTLESVKGLQQAMFGPPLHQLLSALEEQLNAWSNTAGGKPAAGAGPGGPAQGAGTGQTGGAALGAGTGQTGGSVPGAGAGQVGGAVQGAGAGQAGSVVQGAGAGQAGGAVQDAGAGQSGGAVQGAGAGQAGGAVQGAGAGQVGGAVHAGAGQTGGAVQGAGADQVGGAVQGTGAGQAGGAVQGAGVGQAGGSVQGAGAGQAGGAVQGAGAGQVGGAVQGAGAGQSGGTVQGAGAGAGQACVALQGAGAGQVDGAVQGASVGQAGGAVHGAGAGQAGGAVPGAGAGQVGGAVQDAGAGQSGGAVQGVSVGQAGGAVQGAGVGQAGGAVQGIVAGQAGGAMQGAGHPLHAKLQGVLTELRASLPQLASVPPGEAAGPAPAPAQAAPRGEGAPAAGNAAGGAPAPTHDTESWVGRVLKLLGAEHEQQAVRGAAADAPRGAAGPELAGRALAAEGQAAERAETLKGVLLQLLGADDVPAPVKEAAGQLVQHMTGQQLLLNTDRTAPFAQVTMFLPLHGQDGVETASLQIQSRRGRKGELDAANCRLWFDLDMRALGQTLVDVQVVDRIVSLKLHNDTPWALELLESHKEAISASLESIGYQLSGLRTEPLPERYGQGDDQTLSKAENYVPDAYKGVDFRI
ncbi:DNA ligase [Paenibacillus sp. CN-4]|uniref:DNA ligase n=1 Tax=Paenibacillus nanchangensis TaxID=3348343 RepID=UPI00397A8294